MQKRFLSITIVSAILFIVALGGYLIPIHADEPPMRILLKNKGGKVILNHQEHINIVDGKCASCHHTTGDAQNPPACSGCHAAQFNAAFVLDHQKTIDKAHCASCHHAKASIDNFSHDDHAAEYTDNECQTCHHDESIEPEPQACANCHSDGSDNKLNLRDATHTRCADSGCHDDFYIGGINGCANCHTRETASAPDARQQACSTCHTVPVEELLPTTMIAFHGKCMGCHEREEVGPFGEQACYQCHMQ
ncbi:cytochrome c3 family protein [Pseudodesulfovibrio sediminis]|uniref:Cytochrome c n=1 Tax=Pseudodesulfovibrio sediminis TaxID=2810563 RepID=A0ABM7P3K1_9BACT|nr:cytochrome c3 family protein [Pseudodesulfovibrio sediminis]BCS87427.1 cytochrome c [Pseudodesulfovibrio sediminis]